MQQLERMIPVGYAPSSVVLDAADDALLVANDKGLGTTGFGVASPPTNTAENSYAKYYGVYDFNTHQDLGTVSIVIRKVNSDGTGAGVTEESTLTALFPITGERGCFPARSSQVIKEGAHQGHACDLPERAGNVYEKKGPAS